LDLPFARLFFRFLKHFQPLGFPDSMHSLETYSKPFQAKQSRHLTIAKPRSLPRQFMQTSTNGRFVTLFTTVVTDAGS
jgi:hypothetical protein